MRLWSLPMMNLPSVISIFINYKSVVIFACIYGPLLIFIPWWKKIACVGAFLQQEYKSVYACVHCYDEVHDVGSLVETTCSSGMRWDFQGTLIDRYRACIYLNWLPYLVIMVFLFKFNLSLGQKHYVPQVQPERGSNSGPPGHDSTFHVTETPALTTWPSVTSTYIDPTLCNARNP